jgi:diacylglycerol kinase (ATP)
MSLHPNTRIQSFRYAIRGICSMLRTEFNARVHAAATIIVVAAGFAFGISRLEWLAITLSITAVWCAEGLNTAFESLCDVASPEFDSNVERAKDIAAGSVLIVAIGSIIVGLLVFGRRLLALLAS